MASYRKKPVVIQATQWFKHGDHPAVYKLGLAYARKDQGTIMTEEGPLLVSPGDMIITGVKGEKYPCKPGIFKMTYERVED